MKCETCGQTGQTGTTCNNCQVDLNNSKLNRQAEKWAKQQQQKGNLK